MTDHGKWQRDLAAVKAKERRQDFVVSVLFGLFLLAVVAHDWGF